MFIRSIAISRLLEDDINMAEAGNYEVLVSSMLEGFKGYNNQTDEELQAELNAREIPVPSISSTAKSQYLTIKSGSATI